jgi:hypothetical protein
VSGIRRKVTFTCGRCLSGRKVSPPPVVTQATISNSHIKGPQTYHTRLRVCHMITHEVTNSLTLRLVPDASLILRLKPIPVAAPHPNQDRTSTSCHITGTCFCSMKRPP